MSSCATWEQCGSQFEKLRQRASSPANDLEAQVELFQQARTLSVDVQQLHDVAHGSVAGPVSAADAAVLQVFAAKANVVRELLRVGPIEGPHDAAPKLRAIADRFAARIMGSDVEKEFIEALAAYTQQAQQAQLSLTANRDLAEKSQRNRQLLEGLLRLLDELLTDDLVEAKP